MPDNVSIPMIAALAAAGAVLIGAFFTGIASVMTAWRATLLKVAMNTEAIKGHVNSEKTAAEGREAALKIENMLLREMITDKRQSAMLLAQAAVQRAHSDPAPSPAIAAMPAQLASIEANTAETAENTAICAEAEKAKG